MAQKNYSKEVLKLLEELKKDHPSYRMAQIIITSLEDYGDPSGVTDKEFVFALEKLKAELEYHIVPEDELKQIIEDGKNLDKLLNKGPYSELEEEEDGN